MKRVFYTLVALLLSVYAVMAQAGLATSNTAVRRPFVTNGDSHPIWGQWTSAFYDATLNATVVTWAGTPDATARKLYVAAYYHGLGHWCPGTFTSSVAAGCPNSGALVEAGGYVVGANASTDSHGSPGIVQDQFGRIHVFNDAHQSAAKYFYSTDVRDISAWSAAPDIVSMGFTGFSLTYLNGSIYIVTQGGSGTDEVAVVSGTTVSNGPVASWAAPVFLTNFAPDFGLAGNVVVQGNKLCFGFTGLVVSPLQLSDAYYGCYDTMAGTFANAAGSTSSIPITRTTARANYLVFQTSGTSRATAKPTVAFDGSGTLHLAYADGQINSTLTGAGEFPLYETSWTGAAWAAPKQIAGWAVLGNMFASPMLINTADGVMAAWGQLHKSAGIVGLTDDAVIAYLNAGVWSSPQILVSSTSWPINTFAGVTNGIPQAMLLFSENPANPQGDSSFYGTSALWLYGSTGMFGAPYQTPASLGTLAGYWPFDTSGCSGTTTADASGNGNNGTITGTNCATAQGAGQIAQSLNFNGTPTVNYGNSVTLKPALPITITGWVNQASQNPVYGQMFAVDATDATCAGIVLWITDTGLFELGFGDGLGTGATHFWIANTVLPFVSSGKWQFLAMTIEFKSVWAYTQNFRKQLTAVAGTAAAFGYGTSAAISGLMNVSPCWGMVGSPRGPMDDLRMYAGKLAPWQISQIFWQGVAGHN